MTHTHWASILSIWFLSCVTHNFLPQLFLPKGPGVFPTLFCLCHLVFVNPHIFMYSGSLDPYTTCSLFLLFPSQGPKLTCHFSLRIYKAQYHALTLSKQMVLLPISALPSRAPSELQALIFLVTGIIFMIGSMALIIIDWIYTPPNPNHH